MGGKANNVATPKVDNATTNNAQKVEYEKFDFENSNCVFQLPLQEVPEKYRYCSRSAERNRLYFVVFREVIGNITPKNLVAWIGRSFWADDKGTITAETEKSLRAAKDPHYFLRVFQENANPEKFCALVVKSKWERW